MYVHEYKNLGLNEETSYAHGDRIVIYLGKIMEIEKIEKLK